MTRLRGAYLNGIRLRLATKENEKLRSNIEVLETRASDNQRRTKGKEDLAKRRDEIRSNRYAKIINYIASEQPEIVERARAHVTKHEGLSNANAQVRIW